LHLIAEDYCSGAFRWTSDGGRGPGAGCGSTLPPPFTLAPLSSLPSFSASCASPTHPSCNHSAVPLPSAPPSQLKLQPPSLRTSTQSRFHTFSWLFATGQHPSNLVLFLSLHFSYLFLATFNPTLDLSTTTSPSTASIFVPCSTATGHLTSTTLSTTTTLTFSLSLKLGTTSTPPLLPSFLKLPLPVTSFSPFPGSTLHHRPTVLAAEWPSCAGTYFHPFNSNYLSTNHSKPSPYTLPVSLTSSQSSMSTAHLIPPNIPNHSLPFSKKSLHFSLWLAPTPTLSSQAISISTATTHLTRKRFSFSPHCLTSTSSNMSPSLLIPAAIHSTFLSLGTAPHLHPSLASLQLHPTILHFSLSLIYPLLHFILQSLGHSDASTQSIFRTSSLTFLPLSS